MNYQRNRRSRLQPLDIRFTQDSICHIFQDGSSLEDLIHNIVWGVVNVEDIPHMRVSIHCNKYYSWDNRRLYVLRVLQIYRKLTNVTVKIIVHNEFDEKFTTRNDGLSVRVRGGRTLRHTAIQPVQIQSQPATLPRANVSRSIPSPIPRKRVVVKEQWPQHFSGQQIDRSARRESTQQPRITKKEEKCDCIIL